MRRPTCERGVGRARVQPASPSILPMTPLPRRVRLVLGALAVPVLLAGLLVGALLIEPDLARPALVHLDRSQ